MKKTLLFFVILILVIICSVFYIKLTQSHPASLVQNDALLTTYPVLANRNVWAAKWIQSNNPEGWYIPSKNIEIKIMGEQFNFYCGDQHADFIKYSSQTPPSGYVGGWYNLYIVDCGGYYFVYEDGDSGPHLAGPFDKTSGVSSTTVATSSLPTQPVGVNSPVSTTKTPAIQSVIPTTGGTGTTVTLHGTGFLATNTVLFSGGPINNISSTNKGTVLTFTVPSSVGADCKANEACPMYAQRITNGTYTVMVRNLNGTSNSVSYTVVNSPWAIPD